MKVKLPFFFTLSLLLSLSYALNAFAAFEFHPSLNLEEEYNDNLYLTDSNEEDDWITTVEPGFRLLFNNRSVDASIDYSLHYRFYLDNNQENEESFKDVQRANASALFFSGRPFTLQLSESISREALDDRRNNADYNDLVNRTTVYHTVVTPQYRLEFDPTLALVLGYGYDRKDYVDPQGNDTEEHSGRVNLEKTLSSATTVYGGYAYRVFNSDDPAKDFDRQDYNLGLRHQVGARTSVALQGGFSNIEYDSGFSTDSITWLGELSYQLSPAVVLALSYSQDFSVTVSEGVTKAQDAAFSANYEKDELTADTRLYWTNSDYVRQNRTDDVYGWSVGFSNHYSKAFTFNVDGELEYAQYQEAGLPDEDVYRLTLGTSLDYEYRRFLASLGYRHRINNSDIDGNDYTNNIITLSGTVRF